jgi:hypothetical protein
MTQVDVVSTRWIVHPEWSICTAGRMKAHADGNNGGGHSLRKKFTGTQLLQLATNLLDDGNIAEALDVLKMDGMLMHTALQKPCLFWLEQQHQATGYDILRPSV